MKNVLAIFSLCLAMSITAQENRKIILDDNMLKQTNIRVNWNVYKDFIFTMSPKFGNFFECVSTRARSIHFKSYKSYFNNDNLGLKLEMLFYNIYDMGFKASYNIGMLKINTNDNGEIPEPHIKLGMTYAF